MNHWKKTLPNSFYEISYEDLINDQENQITKLLEYCNLPFNEKCYKFSNTNRIVKTSSNKQVRQKIYRSSMGKWKYYKKELFELINTLNIPSQFKITAIVDLNHFIFLAFSLIKIGIPSIIGYASLALLDISSFFLRSQTSGPLVIGPTIILSNELFIFLID